MSVNGSIELKRSQRLKILAEQVRRGDEIDWEAEKNAQALEQAAQDAEFAEAINAQWNQRLTQDNGHESIFRDPEIEDSGEPEE